MIIKTRKRFHKLASLCNKSNMKTMRSRIFSLSSFGIGLIFLLVLASCGSGDKSRSPEIHNKKPVANDDSVTIIVGESVDYDVLKNDTDANGDTLTITDLSNPDNRISATLVDNRVVLKSSGFTGITKIDYRITDGTQVSEPATLNVEVIQADADLCENQRQALLQIAPDIKNLAKDDLEGALDILFDLSDEEIASIALCETSESAEDSPFQ